MTNTVIQTALPGSRCQLFVEKSNQLEGGAYLAAYSGVHLDEAGARDVIDAIAEIFGETVRIKRPPVPAHLAAFNRLDVGDYFTMDRDNSHWWGYKVSDENFVFTSLPGDISTLTDGERRSWPAHELRGWEIKRWTPPTLVDELRALAVGDQYTLTLPGGSVRKGIKIDADQVYDYTHNRIDEIKNYSPRGSVTLTKENA